jgi:DNA-binding beta-propeller fold protein YncE
MAMRTLAAVVCAWISVTAVAQVLETRTVGTVGHPTEAYATADGQFVLVTVNMGGGRGGSSGIEVFHLEGEKLKKVAVQPLGAENAQGILLVPGSRPEMLAVGLSNAGVAFLPLAETLEGKAKVGVLAQGEQSGTGYLAVSPDGQFLFAANEYGEHGNIGVIALHKDAAGALHPELLGQVRTPNTTPGVAISPDGTRLYTEGEVVLPEIAGRLPGHGVAELERSGCTQAKSGPARANGVLYVIDATKAETMAKDMTPQEMRRSVKAAVDAGCSPVRPAVSPDGTTVYLTARGDNKVLVFDAKLLEASPEKAFLRAIPSGGEAPVGVRLFAGGTRMLVANSNRFSPGMAGNAAVFDLIDPTAPKLVQTIQTGEFPRNITVSPDGTTLYLTVFSADELMVLRPK